MKFKILVGCLTAACIVLGSASTSLAATYTTVGAPPSSMLLEVYFGPPSEGGIVIGAIGPLSVTGTASATVSTDGFGDGSLTFSGSNLVLETSLNNEVHLLIPGDPDADPPTEDTDLGTLFADLVDVTVGVSSTATPVQGGVWNLDSIGAPTALDLALDNGTITLHTLSGFIAGFVADPTVLDLLASPVSVSIADLLGFNIGGTASPGAISLNIPGVAVDVGAAADLPGILFVQLSGDINLTLVPEPSTFAMLGIGLVGLIPVVRRKLRKA